jgi:hypothetical protein
MREAELPTPLEIAEAGGKHSGFLSLRLNRSISELQREAAALRRRAAEHREKIENRIGYNAVSVDPEIQRRAEAGRTRHLQREIENFNQQAELCEELASRKLRQPQ